MTPLIAAEAGWFSYFVLGLLMFLTAVFLILLVLVQRGRGGGLTGALGGMGGQSAFGTKAGDVFTQITMYTAAFWIVLCAFSIVWLSSPGDQLGDETSESLEATDTPGAEMPLESGGGQGTGETTPTTD
jgi:preprotein translocase subunit SecG